MSPRRSSGVRAVSSFPPFRLKTPAGEIAGWSLQGDRAWTPILFIHPINLQGACWYQVADGVSPRRTAFMPDLRGHGNSSAEGPFGLEEWGSDCVAVLDHFEVDSVHLVGGSLGGPLAVYLAALQPDRVESITSIGGALHIEGDNPESVLAVLREKGVQGMFREVLPTISVAPGTDAETLERILALTNPNDAETVAAIWGATIASDAHEAARSVRCPALVINGEYDATCTPEQGEEMADALGTTLTLMDGVGHLPMFEAPVPLAALISEHLERAEA